MTAQSSDRKGYPYALKVLEENPHLLIIRFTSQSDRSGEDA